MRLEKLTKIFVGEASSLGQAVHATTDFNINETVDLEVYKVVLFEDSVGEHVKWDFHVFVAFHGCAEIEILEINAHKTTARSGNDAVK